MTAVENNLDVDLFSNLQSTESEIQSEAPKYNEQESFVRKCIHPPSAVPGYAGLPTNDARSEVNLEWRTMNINRTPFICDVSNGKVRAVQPNDLNAFDYAYLHTNGGRVLSIPFIRNATNPNGNMTQDVNNVTKVDQYDFKNWHKDANLFRVAYKSSTHYLNATMFNDTGIVTGNQFNPSLLFSGKFLALADFNPCMFYSMIKEGLRLGIYTIANSNDLISRAKYHEIAQHHRHEIHRKCGLNQTDIIKMDPNVNIQIINFGTTTDNGIVPTNSQILQNSMRSYGGKAKEGAFSVQRLNTIAPSWHAAATTKNDDLQGLYECWYSVVDKDTDQIFVSPFYDNCAEGTPCSEQPILLDTIWTSDMTFSWVSFTGLSLNSQTSTSTQLMILKQYIGIEVQPATSSAWSGMMKLGPKPDLTAMQGLMDAMYELKDVLPARYNFWGVLGQIAGQGIQTFGNAILNSLLEKDKPKKNKGSVKQMEKKMGDMNIGRPNKTKKQPNNIQTQPSNNKQRRPRKQHNYNPAQPMVLPPTAPVPPPQQLALVPYRKPHASKPKPRRPTRVFYRSRRQ